MRKTISTAAILGLTFLMANAWGQNTFSSNAYGQYQKWDSGNEKIEKMIDELEIVIDRATKARAADPNFLWDLNDIIKKYKIPRQTVFLSDDFSDADLSTNPQWQSLGGSFRIDRFGALYSSVAVRRPAARSAQQNSGQNDDGLGLLLGLLGEIGVENQNQPNGTNSAKPDEALILTKAALPNNFICEFTLRSESNWGAFQIGFFQGDKTNTGYHLTYYPSPANDRPMQIIKYRHGEPYIVDTAGQNSPNLDDGADHSFRWQRLSSGEMTLSVDGNQVLTTNDLTYRQDFDGIVIKNLGGAFGVDNIKVYTER